MQRQLKVSRCEPSGPVQQVHASSQSILIHTVSSYIILYYFIYSIIYSNACRGTQCRWHVLWGCHRIRLRHSTAPTLTFSSSALPLFFSFLFSSNFRAGAQLHCRVRAHLSSGIHFHQVSPLSPLFIFYFRSLPSSFSSTTCQTHDPH